MSIFTEAQAREICEKAIKFSTADECTVGMQGGRAGNIRFALNNVSTSGSVDDTQLFVNVAFGKRTGVTSINRFDDASLERVVRRAEELAKLSPENPEFMPAVEKQAYKQTPTFHEKSAGIDPAFRAEVAGTCIDACRKEKLVAAGYFTDADNFFAVANSKGNFGYQRGTTMDFTCTVRTEDSTGSGWVARNLDDVTKFDPKSEIQTAIRKAKGSVEAKAIEPGKYTVILEPAAAATLISPMMFGFDARQSDEGRSFLTKKGGGNRIGEKVFDERVNIHADPWDPIAPVAPWDADGGGGLAREKTTIVKNGVVEYLQYSRYWAKEKGKRAVGQPGNIFMAGGTKTTDELVKSTKRGILVTRTWYIRMVDPQTVLLTGLTRDGTFYVEDGEVKYPIKNMRFNESPVIMLNNVEELGKPVRLADNESPFVMVIPPMKLRDFTFTSLSDAV